MAQDPVHHHVKGSEPNHPQHREQDTGWYFWDETWADRVGPFHTEQKARKELAMYSAWLNSPNPNKKTIPMEFTEKQWSELKEVSQGYENPVPDVSLET